VCVTKFTRSRVYRLSVRVSFHVDLLLIYRLRFTLPHYFDALLVVEIIEVFNRRNKLLIATKHIADNLSFSNTAYWHIVYAA